MCATLLMAHGKRPGRSSITAAGDQGHSSSRLFHITDKTTGLRLLVDTGAEVSIIPASKTDRRLREKTTPLQAINSSVIATYGQKSLTLDLGLKKKTTVVVLDSRRTLRNLRRRFLKAFSSARGYEPLSPGG